MLFFLLQILIGVAILYLGANWLVRASTSLAFKAHISPFLIGLTIVGYGTSTPELVVCLHAAGQGHPEIAAGNIVGSNILNSSLILGIGIFLKPSICPQKVRFWDVPFMFFCCVILSIGAYMGFGRVLGGIFLLLLFSYTIASYFYSFKDPDVHDIEKNSLWSIKMSALFLPISFLFLVYGSHLFLAGSIGFAKIYGLSDLLIGLTIAAIGTSLPELATTIAAALRGQEMLVLGGIVGSNIYNTLGILGAVASIHPITLENVSLIDYGFMLGVNGLLLLVVLIKKSLGKPLGAVLFSSYIFYMLALIANAK